MSNLFMGQGIASPCKVMAMILAREPRMPAPEAVRRELAKTHHVKIDHAGGAMWAMDVDGQPSFVGLMPMPIPWSQLEGPCATAWWWPEATPICKASPAHFVVSTQSDDGDVFAANLRLTAIVAAFARAAEAPAVYWGAGAVVRSTVDFAEQADMATREYLPLRLWLEVRVTPEGKNDSFFATTGMTAFGLMEIETIAPRAQTDHVLDRMFNLAHYLCDSGPVLEHGHTIGLSADERVEISHRPSRWKRPGNVIFLSW
ncbi:hypothetical protein AKJ09_02510 [Labilithrix luteola]|uniref:DUF4261 domain-containing protein n=1 Tax=Labilithrix luteola TaxID=1391654 RepID=A0A0K1PR44_9BACT|nr:DUF4261 domain-containing protein [Labilithrix luteola]AKU95846.1 hypothetical protein AKJ09_02510 [Labilithrix luteola]